jgi:hypothetical protein
MPSLNETKRKILERNLATALQEYAIANHQLLAITNDVDRGRLKKQVASLEAQAQQYEDELKKLELTEVVNAPSKDWRIYLPRLNFKEAVEITKELLVDKSENSAALFLIPNNLAMGGKWCVARIRELLEEGTADFLPYVVESIGVRAFSEKWILDSLAQHLNVTDLPKNHRQAARKIIEALRHSVRSGSIRFLEIRGWEFLHDFSEILTWFIEDFWIPLTKELIKIEGEYRKVRFVAIIIADEPLPEEKFLAALLCTRANFNAERILELPLQHWSKEEIEEWLESYLQLSSEEIKRLSRKVYNSSNSGLPSLVHEALAKHLGG